MNLHISLAIEAVRSGRPYDHLTAKSEALVIGWAESFAPVLEEHDVLEVETEFSFPLLNPETGAPSRSFDEAGKIDGVLRHRKSGQIKVLEHKTTSDSIEPDALYWGKLTMDSQISKYILARRNKGEDVYSVLYDVIRKPAHRVAQIPQVDENGVKIVLDQNGARVRTKDGKKWRESGSTEEGYLLQTTPETPEQFRDRILSIMRSERGGYFVHREIPRLDSDLLEYMGDAWALSQQILHYRGAKLWPRNPGACTAFGTCEFFTLCLGRDSVDGIKFGRKEKAHAELAIAETQSRQFLTNSRLNALRKCARYHFLRYEEPTEAIGESDEALTLGTLFHRGAEVFLKSHINPQPTK